MKIKNFKRYLNNSFNLLHKRLFLDSQDIIAMQYLKPISDFYLPWTSYAIRPSGLVAIINEIIINNRISILECGGGISTIYIAKILQERTGHLYTIEHDPNWIAELKKLLAQQELTDCVTFIAAPLKDCSFKFQQSHNDMWYCLDALQEALNRVEIDLLIVDGPPAYGTASKYARYPAVPFLKQYFTSDYAIILDDINRSGERKIVVKWQQELGIHFKKYVIKGGIAIAYSQAKSMSLL